jgi:DNA replication licensing factor MCM7
MADEFSLQQKIANREQERLVIDLEDLVKASFLLVAALSCLMSPQYEKSIGGVVNRIRSNTRRYTQLFSEVIDEIMPNPTKDISHLDDVLDVIIHQRREKNLANGQDGQNLFPPMLTRR